MKHCLTSSPLSTFREFNKKASKLTYWFVSSCGGIAQKN